MTSNPFLSGNFAPVPDESTAFDLPVRGRIPAELAGRLLRIGPNPIAPGDDYHWFLGNGMVHGLSLGEGRARWYRNRFVRDDELCAARSWPEVPGPRFSELSGGGANTNVIQHAGKIYAIVEAGGNPVELDDELETVARSDFSGTLPGPFSAHPKRCPDTGELHVLGYYPGWEYLQYVVVGSDGRVRKTVDIPAPARPMIHDCALTANYFIVFDLPVILDVESAEAGGGGLPYRWSDTHPTRVGLLPRDGGAEDIVWSSVEPCFVFHPLNAYEDASGRVVLDVVRHPKLFDVGVLGSAEGVPTLDRWLVDPAGGSVKESRLCERPQEFPRIDERRTAKAHRYGYCGSPGGEGLFGGLLKHDLQRGETLHRDDPGHLYQEAVFVARSPDADEDDGYVMAYAHDVERDAGEVVILHAQDFLGEAVARVELPVRVPFGFHGNWVPDA